VRGGSERRELRSDENKKDFLFGKNTPLVCIFYRALFSLCLCPLVLLVLPSPCLFLGCFLFQSRVLKNGRERGEENQNKFC